MIYIFQFSETKMEHRHKFMFFLSSFYFSFLNDNPKGKVKSFTDITSQSLSGNYIISVIYFFFSEQGKNESNEPFQSNTN